MVTGRTPGFVALVVILSFLFPAITEQAVPRQTERAYMYRTHLVAAVLGMYNVVSETALLSRTPPNFNQGQVKGTVTSHHINEASGLAVSRRHPGYLYTQNDHGDGANIYVISGTGHREATLSVHGATSNDWEDLSVGPCDRISAKTCIYVADTGDSRNSSKNIVYKIEEPDDITSSQTVPFIAKLEFSWNQPDCETLLVDPRANVYLISKVQNGGGVIVQLPETAWNSGSSVTLSSTATFSVPPTGHHDPVGGDISPDGSEVLIILHEGLLYWDMHGSTDYVAALQKPGQHVPYRNDEPQGEAVCWDLKGQGYYTLSEGVDQPLYYYSRA